MRLIKIIILILAIPIFGVRLGAQQAVSCAGGSASGPGGSISFTCGQIDFQNVTGYWEGVQQPYSVSFVNGYTQAITICQNTGAHSIDAILEVNDAIIGQPVTWAQAIAPMHGSLVAAYSTIATGVILPPVGLTYTPALGFTGPDSFKIKAVGGNDTTYTTVHVTINPRANAGTITGGLDSICQGTATTLADATASPVGIWHSANPSIASVTAGVVIGIGAGSTNIFYTSTNGCGTDTAFRPITILPAAIAGSLSGATSVCIGSTISITSSQPGGSWSCNTALGTIDGSGVLTGSVQGIDTIHYTVTNSCGTAMTTKLLTIKDVPGSITGIGVVCVAQTTTLGNSAIGGTWTSSNYSIANPGFSGVVTGIGAGTATITYSNGCGSPVTMLVTVNPLPDAGVISGVDSVCVGASITLSTTISGGTWSSSNTNVVLLGNVVAGVMAGTVTISYGVTNSCGNGYTTKLITIVPLPAIPTISGPSVVCATDSILFTSDITGGIWGATNTLATVSGGMVRGIAGGADTITYMLIGYCSSVLASKPITINPLPTPTAIIGLDSLCAGTHLLLSVADTTGTWVATNSNATISAGDVLGMSAGVDTINYTLTNSCGSTTTSKTITIAPLPVAGTITGVDSLCVSTNYVLNSSATGGTWSITNNHLMLTDSMIRGLTKGLDTVVYHVANACGDAYAQTIVYVKPLPSITLLTGPDSVCVSDTVILLDSIPGGGWSCTNNKADVYNGSVVGNNAGMDTVYYQITNTCGTGSASKTIYIKPYPDAGSITGFGTVCTSTNDTLTETVTGGTWYCSGSQATVSSTGVVTGVSPGVEFIYYAVANSCGTSTTSKPILVSTLPTVSLIAGPAVICQGDTITYTDSVSSGTWSSSNTNVLSLGSGKFIGLLGGQDSIAYQTSNICGMARQTKLVSIDTPLHPSVTGASYVCIGNTTIMSGSPAGGVWSTSNTDATISTGGQLTGVTGGVDTLTYSVNNTCGTKDTSYAFLVHTAHECDSINLVPDITGSQINVFVYPNPNHGSFTVELPANTRLSGTTIAVTDLLGKTIETKTIVGDNERFIAFDMRTLAAATYFVKVTINEQSFRTKLVVW